MRKKFIDLTEQQLETLQQGHQHHPSAPVRDRCHCLLLSHQGKQVKELALIFSVIPLTIYGWFYRWEAKGLIGLFNQKGGGRQAILTCADSVAIKEKVQAHHQKLSLAREELKAELHKEFSEKTLKRFLKSLVYDGNVGANA